MSNDFEIPTGLSRLGRQAAQTIVKHARGILSDASGGGCRAFYTPQEWRERGEQYGLSAELIVVHDGGDLNDFFSYDSGYYTLVEGMNEALSAVGVYAESCTCWYTAIYPA
jgi:hypothetical protein